MEVYVTSRGRMVIPSAIRKQLGITAGTRINIEVDEEKYVIALHPVTPAVIRSFKGILKSKAREKSATRQLLEDRAEELRRGRWK